MLHKEAASLVNGIEFKLSGREMRMFLLFHQRQPV
jgi:hypothetical protein